jgi:hypothetical protein
MLANISDTEPPHPNHCGGRIVPRTILAFAAAIPAGEREALLPAQVHGEVVYVVEAFVEAFHRQLLVEAVLEPFLGIAEGARRRPGRDAGGAVDEAVRSPRFQIRARPAPRDGICGSSG